MVSNKEDTESRNASHIDMTSTSSLTQGEKFPQYIAAIIVNIASFANGCVIGWSSPMLPILQSKDSPLQGGPISNETGSWLGSLMCLGALFATPLYLFITHHYSRKLTGYLIAVPFIISWFLIITTNSTTLLYVARFFGGVGSGAITVFAPLYVSETAEDNVRGGLGSYFVLFSNFGILFGYIIGSYVSYYTVAYICITFPFVYLLLYTWLPETPLYLVDRIKYTEATNSLRWLRGRNSRLLEHELTKLISFVKERKAATGSKSLKDMISSEGTRRALIIGLVLSANLQFCGVFAILSYTANIFQEAGSDLSPNASTMLIGALQLAGSYASSLLLDKAGRKILLLVSNMSMAICLATLGTYFFFKNQGTDVSDFGWLPIACLSVYIFAVALGMAPITFLIISEIFEPQVRSKATTIIISFMWMLTFLIGKFYTNLSDLLGIHGCYWLFSVCCIFGSIFAIFVVPETKNRSFESILHELSGKRHGEKRSNNLNEVDSL